MFDEVLKMKVLVKKIENLPELDEVYLQPWHNWVDADTGVPLTAECYGYALCEVPDDAEDLSADDFEVKVSVEVGEDGEKRKVYTAEYKRAQ